MEASRALDDQRGLSGIFESPLDASGVVHTPEGADLHPETILALGVFRLAIPVPRLSLGRFLPPDHRHLDRGDPVDVEADLLGAGITEIDDPALDERPTIGDPELDIGTGVAPLHLDHGAKGEGAVRRGHLVHVVDLARCRPAAMVGLAIPRGEALFGLALLRRVLRFLGGFRCRGRLWSRRGIASGLGWWRRGGQPAMGAARHQDRQDHEG